MKNRILFFALCCGLLFSSDLKSQVLMICAGDSVRLVLQQPHSGTITWYSSPDNLVWSAIAASDNDTIYVDPATFPFFYKASVQQNVACPVYYSSSYEIVSGLWPAGLAVNNIYPETVGAYSFYSSSKLGVSWTAPGAYVVDHYQIVATENIGNSTDYFDVPATQTADTITGLKSATTYNISIKACADPACNSYLACNANTASATTDSEYWQVNGTPGSNSFNDAYKIYPNANVLSYAFPYGSWADPELQGKVRHYGTPNVMLGTSGTVPALANSVAVSNDINSVSQFTMDSLNGLSYNDWVFGQNMFPYIGQSVAIPYNGKIRLFFNATLDDNSRRVFYIDSQDGYIGKDFDDSADSLCTDTFDWNTGGNCDYTLALGINTDAGFTQNLNVEHVMQFKIGYPMLDNEWIWEGDSAFMVSTIGLPLAPNDSCTNLANKCGYSNWNGTDWEIEYNADDFSGACPKLFLGMRCPSIVHMGGNKYKLYYGNNQTLQTAPSDVLKPKYVMYAYGDRYPRFDDWEGMALAREIFYLWPDGTLLSDTDESKFDDYTYFAPVAGDPDFQIQYTNMTPSAGPPFVGMTYLLNP